MRSLRYAGLLDPALDRWPERPSSDLSESGLEETVKWAHPCYLHAGRNIAIFGAFRGDFRLTFMNAGLLNDSEGVLEPQGPNSRTPGMIRFTEVGQVGRMEPVIRAYLRQLMDHAKRDKAAGESGARDRHAGGTDRGAGRRSRVGRGVRGPDTGAAKELPIRSEPGQAIGDPRGADREVSRQDHRREGCAGVIANL